MCDRVEPGGGAKRLRHRHGQLDVVDHRLGQDLWTRLRCLQPVAGLAKDRCHLRAGIAGRHHDLRQIGSQRNRLAEPGRRAATDRNNAIDLQLSDVRHGAVSDVDRRMHRRLGKNSGGATAEHRGNI